jgi:hypothetical protein
MMMGRDPFEEPWLAYTFDRAVMVYGQYVDNLLSETDKKGRPKYELKEILEDPDALPGAKPKKYRGNAQMLMALFGNKASVAYEYADVSEITPSEEQPQ